MSADLQDLRLGRAYDAPANEARGGIWKVLTFLSSGAAAVLAFLYVTTSANAIEGVVVQTFPVSVAETRGAASVVTAGGWAEPRPPYPVAVCPLVYGRIEQFEIVEGQTVEAGQVIAKLYQDDLAEIMNQAEAERDAAQARLERLQAGARAEEIALARAEAQTVAKRLELLEAGSRPEEIQKAERDVDALEADEAYRLTVWNRSKDLSERGTIATDDAARDRAAWAMAKARTAAAAQELVRLRAGTRKEMIEEASAELAAAEAKVALLEAGSRAESIAEAEAELKAKEAAYDLASARQGYTEVTCPMTGTVYEMSAHMGGYVTPDKPVLFTVYDPALMQVRVDVRQDNFSKVYVGQDVSIRTAARPDQPYWGKVTQITPKGNLARDSVRVLASIAEADNLLFSDMTVTVNFLQPVAEEEKLKDQLTMPAAALDKSGDKTFVYVVRQGHAWRREVKTGEQVGQRVIVLDGVKNGERVAIGGIEQLDDGMRVIVKN